MTGETVRDASMTSDVRPGHCANTTYAEPAHMGRAHAAEILFAEATDMGSTETTEMRRSAEAADMGSAETTDMRPAEATDMCSAHSAAKSADMTAAAHTAKSAATASVSGARCGEPEHDDRRCCSENIRHDEPL
jgi:hypothetical protein